MLRQLSRTVKQIKDDSPCVGVCTLNEDNVCIGCNRTIEEIAEAGNAEVHPIQ
jgi:predicted Fe-S protein YdhL (DUF1289 family)